MKEVNIFADYVDEKTQEQFNLAMEQDYVVKGALMPDCHAGYTLPIGSVIATNGVIVPSYVGYDIGCGMLAYKTNYHKVEIENYLKNIFDEIYRTIPVGFNHNTVDVPWDNYNNIEKTSKTHEIFMKDGFKQHTTLGSGNHFQDLSYDEQGNVWVVIHSGSRGIGHSVASHYMRLASNSEKAIEGHFGLRTDSEIGKDYIIDLNFCLEFALENRKGMLKRVLEAISKFVPNDIEIVEGDIINRNHNHAEYKNELWIHRKGATHADLGMRGVIPGNMRDGSFVVCGKGNEKSMCSSSHGAGRVMGRKEATRKLNIEDFEKSMEGIVARVNKDTLDESPMAYKNIFDVMEMQKDLVDVVCHLKPLINIKG